MTTVIRNNTKDAKAAPASRALPGKKGIDRLRVLDAARRLCDAHGVGSLSIREIADSLGIRPPSVYAHFDGLPAIRHDLGRWAHHALAEALRNSAVGLAGTDALIAACAAYLRFIREQPGLYGASAAPGAMLDPDLHEAANEWLSVLRQLLASLGLDMTERTHALRGIRSMVHGFGQLEAGGQFRTPVDRDVSFDRMVRTFLLAVARRR